MFGKDSALKVLNVDFFLKHITDTLILNRNFLKESIPNTACVEYLGSGCIAFTVN